MFFLYWPIILHVLTVAKIAGPLIISPLGMRIDHFVGAEVLSPRVESVEILGWGYDREREGCGFFGSDHCPVFLKLALNSPPG